MVSLDKAQELPELIGLGLASVVLEVDQL